jgi:hypothetical protein
VTALLRAGWQPVSGTPQVPVYPSAASTGPAAGGYSSLTPVTLSAETKIQNSPYPSWVSNPGSGPLLVSGVAFTVDTPNFEIYANEMTFTGCSFVSPQTAWATGPIMITLYGTGPYVFSYCSMCGSDGTSATRIEEIVAMNADCNLTIEYCNMYYMRQAVNIKSNTALGVTIANSYIHDVVYYAGDHSEPIYGGATSPGGSNITITGNTILNPLTQTAAIDFNVATFTDCEVSGNFLAGGGYTIYLPSAASSGIVIQNNVFSTMYYAEGGVSGPYYTTAYPVFGVNENIWSNNTWADGEYAGMAIAQP